MGVYLEKLNEPRVIEVLYFSTMTPKPNFLTCGPMYCRKKLNWTEKPNSESSFEIVILSTYWANFVQKNHEKIYFLWEP